MGFPRRLKALRAERDITQVELAKVLGVAPNTLATWEQGRSRPDISKLAEIATYFGVSVDYLLGLTDIKMPTARYYYNMKELRDIGFTVAEDLKDKDTIEFERLMREEELTPEFLAEILPVIRLLKKHVPTDKE